MLRNLSYNKLFWIGVILNLVAGNLFFLYFCILNALTWGSFDNSFLSLLCVFTPLCLITFYIVFYKTKFYQRSTMYLVLLSILCCFVITFVGGFAVGLITSLSDIKFTESIFQVSEILNGFFVCLVFGIMACFIFSKIVIPVGFVNWLWFILMKRAKLRELRQNDSDTQSEP